MWSEGAKREVIQSYDGFWEGKLTPEKAALFLEAVCKFHPAIVLDALKDLGKWSDTRQRPAIQAIVELCNERKRRESRPKPFSAQEPGSGPTVSWQDFRERVGFDGFKARKQASKG